MYLYIKIQFSIEGKNRKNIFYRRPRQRKGKKWCTKRNVCALRHQEESTFVRTSRCSSLQSTGKLSAPSGGQLCILAPPFVIYWTTSKSRFSELKPVNITAITKSLKLCPCFNVQATDLSIMSLKGDFYGIDCMSCISMQKQGCALMNISPTELLIHTKEELKKCSEDPSQACW